MPDASTHPVAETFAGAAGVLNTTARRTADRLDAGRWSVAAGLDKTAGAVRSYAPEAVVRQARSAADAMENAASYIRRHDVSEMTADLTDAVRRNPGPTLIGAVAVGFLLGVAMRRK